MFDRPEITNAIRSLVVGSNFSNQLADMPSTYVTSLIHATSKMKIEDAEVWNSLASYVA